MAYPTDLDVFANPVGTNTLDNPDHAGLHRSVGSAVEALEAKLGVAAGSPTLNKVLVGSGNGTTAWGTQVNNLGLGTPTIGTPAVTGGTIAVSVISGGTQLAPAIGTPNITGGSMSSGIFNNATLGTPSVTGGTINGAVLGTPTIGTITVPGTVAALGFSRAIAPGVGSVADSAGGTLVVNASDGNLFYSAMGTAAGNRTIGTPLNSTAYQQLTYAFKPSGSANGTLVWDSNVYRFSDAGTPQIGTSTTWHYFGWRRNAIDSKYDFQGQVKLV